MSIGDKVRVAIETECSAIKAGNVHPSASFHDLEHRHFVAAANAIGQAVDRCVGQSVGSIAMCSAQAMMDTVGTNTSLGTILLLAPLVATHHRSGMGSIECTAFSMALQRTLANLTPADARDIYKAIQIAKPGGLGDATEMDVRGSAPKNILDAMRLAADRDDIALQYVTQFDLVFSLAERLQAKLAAEFAMLDAIRCVQMELLSERVDGLIARKQGIDFAKRVQQQASRVLASGPYGSAPFEAEWLRLDDGLRDEAHRGNPGTIADLIAAALFVLEE